MAEMRRINSLADELRYGRDRELGLAREAVADDPLGELRGAAAAAVTGGAGLTSLVADLVRKPGVMDYESPVTGKGYAPELKDIPGTQEWALDRSGYDEDLAMSPFAMLDPGSISDAGKLAQIVWHGTPHRWRMPSSQHIGKGVGAQAYSEGLYWAGDKGVAKGYRDKLGDRGGSVTYDGTKVWGDNFADSPSTPLNDVGFSIIRNNQDPARAIELTRDEYEQMRERATDYLANTQNKIDGWLKVKDEAATNPDVPDSARDFIEKELQGELDKLIKLEDEVDQYDDWMAELKQMDPALFGKTEPESYLYEMDLPDEVIDRMMQWDRPFPDQPANVKAFLLRNPDLAKDMAGPGGTGPRDFFGQVPRGPQNGGRALYGRLKQKNMGKAMMELGLSPADMHSQSTNFSKLDNLAGKMATDQLREAGIPGMKYDNWTRNRPGESEKNFVTYNDEDIIPLARNNDILNDPDQVGDLRSDILRRMEDVDIQTGRGFFDPEALKRYENPNPGSREIIVDMSPDEFLDLALPLPNGDDSKLIPVRNLAQRGSQFTDIPYLGFDNMLDGPAQVKMHEGRHRALALKELGVKKMPVRLISREYGTGPAIRWGKQDYENFDLVHPDDWPTKIEQESGGNIRDFPISRPENDLLGRRYDRPKPKKDDIDDLSNQSFLSRILREYE